MALRLVALVALLLLPMTAGAAVITFDTTPGGAGGTLTYDGAGGPAIGTGIAFVNLQGLGTPLNDGALLTCTSCLLNFTTGANTGEEGPNTWQWAGGGSFVLHGNVPALGIVDQDLLAGTFTTTPNTPGLAAAGTSALFIALGTDVKNETLLDFYGLTNPFVFANTEIALETFTADPVTGAFTAIPNQADIINATQVSAPQPFLLIVLGLGLSLIALKERATWR